MELLPTTPVLLADLKTLIAQARQRVALAVNAELTMLYWHIGTRINAHLAGEEGSRAAYGKQVVATLARELSAEYGTSFAEKSLRRMMQSAEAFPEFEIVVTLSRQLTWSHLLLLTPLQEPLKRTFYTEMCRVERWSVRTLRDRVDSMLFERTDLSKKPDERIRLELDALHAQCDVTPPLLLRDTWR